MNALMLTLAVRFGGGRIRLLRVFAGALAGALIASAIRALALSRMQTACMWLPAAMIMMCIAEGRTALRTPVKSMLLLMCAAGLAGGTVLSFYGATGSLTGAYVLGALGALAAGLGAARVRRSAPDVHHARIICKHREIQASFDAMIDSGNTLRDYLTHLPVIVLPKAAAAQTLTIKDMPLRPIFAETAGGRQRMSVLAPQKIELQCQGIRRRVNAVIALSPQMGVNVPALVPAALLDEQGN